MRVYHVGNGKPPFVFEYASEEIIIYPPDQLWERWQEPFEVTASDGKAHKFKRNAWRLKESQVGSKHRNYIDLTEDQMRFLNKGIFEDARSEYIKTTQELGEKLTHELDDVQKKHEAKIKALQDKQEAEIKELEKKHIEHRKNVVRM